VLSARLAELRSIEEVLGRAAGVVERGWLQHAWFVVATPAGPSAVTAYDVDMAEVYPVTGACLVGAVVAAAGGPKAVGTQLTQRTLDLTWHTLREDSDRPVKWCPGPGVRTLQVLDLTHWNDDPSRTRPQVVDLLRAAGRAARTERDRVFVELEATDRPAQPATDRPS
jgi:hypothetical protein